MSERHPLSLSLNGEARHAQAALHDTLLTILRERFQLTAAKRGCNQGVCGACTVLVDGHAMRGCLSLALNCVDAEVVTLEGLAQDRTMQALQDAFELHGAFQCGFCTPGMLVAAHALLQASPHPSLEEARRGLSGNLCRCTGYKKILQAVLAAAQALRTEPAR